MMKELTSNLPTAEEIVRALGLQSNRRDLTPSLALFGAGILVGAGLAMLFTPRTGEELREELSQRATELKDRVSGAMEQAVAENGRET